MDSLWIMITVMLVLSAITAVLTFMYNAGKKSAKRKQTVETLRQSENGKKTRETIDRSYRDSGLRERMRDKYTK